MPVMRPLDDPEKCHYPVFQERAPRGYKQCGFWAQEKIKGQWYCHRHAKALKP